MKKNGFTLIETLIALFIMAGGILMISLAWSGSIMHMRKSALFNDVSTLLERKMVELEAYYKDKDLKEIPDEDGGDFGTDHPQYRWTLKSREMKFPDISALIIGQDSDGAQDQSMLLNMIKQMTEYLDKTVKEVKVTIFVKSKGGKEVSFSASQYFIDYSQDFAGAMGGAAGGGGGGTAPTTPATGAK